MKKEICHGCRAHICLATVYGCEEDCPCIECLVKPICDQWCNTRLVFVNTLNTEKLDEKMEGWKE